MLGCILLTQCLYMAAVIATKWLLLGRLRPGTYANHSETSQRLWTVVCLLDMPLARGFVKLFAGTPVLCSVLAMLGARVGKGARIIRPTAIMMASADQLALGKDCLVESGATVLGAMWNKGMLLASETRLGDRCTLPPLGPSARTRRVKRLPCCPCRAIVSLDALVLPGADVRAGAVVSKRRLRLPAPPLPASRASLTAAPCPRLAGGRHVLHR